MNPAAMPEREFSSVLPILTTKLYRLPVGPDLEPRDNLLFRLDRNRMRPLTLISAPAGYGKTTLASMWVEASGWVSAWVSLDEEDNDLLTFAGYLVAALGRAFPGIQFRTGDLLGAPGPLPPGVLVRYLMNDLEQIEEPFILALDDLYTIHEQAVFDLLSQLLRHRLPTMHLLLITRRDPPLPIASLRARRQITEVRTRDLRFTVTETTRLLSTMLHREVDEETAAQWTQRTEGWVTALQLAALSLRHRGQLDTFDAAMPENDRYLQEYLLAEVLAALPPEREEYLLAMSVVERFCATLTEVLCQSADGGKSGIDGEAMIDWLHDQNLFLIPLDDQQRWFRFHHLFQNLLRERLRRQLPTEKFAALHLRAGRWFDDNGLWDEALRHFLAAEDTSAAVEHVISHRYELINSQQWQRLFHWLQLLPADVVTQNPYLASAITFLATHMHSVEHSEMRTRMQQAEQTLTALPPGGQEYQVVQAEIATNQSAVAIMAGDAVLAEALARRSLDVLPEQAILTRHLANTVIGASMQMRGEYHAGVSRIKEVLVGSDLPAAVRSHSLHSLCLVRMMEGDLNGVIASALECLRTSEGSGNRWMQNHARHHLGVAHYLRNEIESAEPYLSALHDDRVTSAPSYLAFGAIALALICASKHQWDQAQHVVESVSSQFGYMNSQFAIEVTKAFSVELAIRRGDIAHAQQLSGQIDYGLRPPMWFFYVPQLTPLKLLWAESTPEGLARARANLEALDEQMAAIHRKAVRIDVLSLMALVCDAQGETTTACDKLAQALKLAEPGGFIRNFVDLGPPMADLLVRFQRRNQAMTPEMQRHLERILAAFYSSRARDAGSFTRTIPAKSASVELLTPRELQILRLLATELSPHEIAGELVMSTSTVRTHIKNIYAKMGVHSRMEAVHRAGVLRLQ